MKHGMHKDKKRKGYMGGMKVEKVDGIMDGNKAARRENMYGGGRMKYNAGKLVKKAMKKAMPC